MNPVVKYILAGVVIAVGIAVIFNLEQDSTVINERLEPETLEVVTPVVEKWMTDEEAIQAAKDVVRKKELEAELIQLKDGWSAATAEYENQKKEYLLKKETLEKELGTY